MASPISYDRRVKIVKRKQSGEDTASIAESLGTSVSGVRKIWVRYQEVGEAAYYPNYEKCGRKTPFDSTIIDSVSSIRDNKQGASYVYSKLLVKHKDQKIPAIRTLQRWWQKSEKSCPKGRPSNEDKKNGLSPLMKLGK